MTKSLIVSPFVTLAPPHVAAVFLFDGSLHLIFVEKFLISRIRASDAQEDCLTLEEAQVPEKIATR